MNWGWARAECLRVGGHARPPCADLRQRRLCVSLPRLLPLVLLLVPTPRLRLPISVVQHTNEVVAIKKFKECEGGRRRGAARGLGGFGMDM